MTLGLAPVMNGACAEAASFDISVSSSTSGGVWSKW